jgi:multiple sugar transport system substrate-binding protein
LTAHLFWSFWCDQVQPGLRQALGCDDVSGVGLPMSPNVDTENTLEQSQLAYEAPWLDRDRRLQVDDPAVRAGMIKALEDYISIWRKGYTPPDSVAWTSGTDNNKAFLA